MTVTTPNWTDPVSIIGATVTSAGNTPKDNAIGETWDLRGAFGGWLELAIGREADTAINVPIKFNVRRQLASFLYGMNNSPFDRVGGTVTAAATTVDADSGPAQTGAENILNVADTTDFVAGNIIAVGVTGSANRFEIRTVSKVDAGVSLELDEDLENDHTLATADYVTNQADVWQMWLPGGSIYLLSLDYGEATSGPDVVVRAHGQSFDSQNTV